MLNPGKIKLNLIHTIEGRFLVFLVFHFYEIHVQKVPWVIWVECFFVLCHIFLCSKI
jgi:hypothetical protein